MQTKRRDEDRANINLARQGFETYLPTLDDEVLFPGYIFVNADNVGPINSTRGVVGLVRFGDQLAIVPDKLIEGFRATEWQRSSDMAPGLAVLVTDGPFKYMQAVVQSKKADRIIVLMQIMNQPQNIELPLTSVAAV